MKMPSPKNLRPASRIFIELAKYCYTTSASFETILQNNYILPRPLYFSLDFCNFDETVKTAHPRMLRVGPRGMSTSSLVFGRLTSKCRDLPWLFRRSLDHLLRGKVWKGSWMNWTALCCMCSNLAVNYRNDLNLAKVQLQSPRSSPRSRCMKTTKWWFIIASFFKCGLPVSKSF
jgi:hypothetical protein